MFLYQLLVTHMLRKVTRDVSRRLSLAKGDILAFTKGSALYSNDAKQSRHENDIRAIPIPAILSEQERSPLAWLSDMVIQFGSNPRGFGKYSNAFLVHATCILYFPTLQSGVVRI